MGEIGSKKSNSKGGGHNLCQKFEKLNCTATKTVIKIIHPQKCSF